MRKKEYKITNPLRSLFDLYSQDRQRVIIPRISIMKMKTEKDLFYRLCMHLFPSEALIYHCYKVFWFKRAMVIVDFIVF
jgi:hypothetical protein